MIAIRGVRGVKMSLELVSWSSDEVFGKEERKVKEIGSIQRLEGSRNLPRGRSLVSLCLSFFFEGSSEEGVTTSFGSFGTSEG